MKKQTKKPAAGRDERRVQQVFHALAAPPRRAILKHLAESGLTAGEIASRFDMAKPSISQHLTILETAGLISRDKRGQFVHYALVRATLDTVLSGFLEELGATGSEAPSASKTKTKKAGPGRTDARKAAAVETANAEVEAANVQAEPAPAQMSMF